MKDMYWNVVFYFFKCMSWVGNSSILERFGRTTSWFAGTLCGPEAAHVVLAAAGIILPRNSFGNAGNAVMCGPLCHPCSWKHCQD